MQHRYDFERFKRDINLAGFAAGYGYETDRKKTTKTSIAMKSLNDKIIITKKQGIWIYFSVADESDNGTIVDFIKNRSQKTMVEIGELLTKEIGVVNINAPKFAVSEQAFDRSRVQAIFAKCKPLASSHYLERRGLPRRLLSSKRFQSRILEDRYGNIVFPHYRGREVCGIELKNQQRGILVKGSQKTFWRSNSRQTDSEIVVTEAVIDALSYHQLFERRNAFHMATGGGVSARQCELFASLLNATKRIEKVIIATDSDCGGDRIAKRLLKAGRRSKFAGKICRHRPEADGDDWNDVLIGKRS